MPDFSALCKSLLSHGIPFCENELMKNHTSFKIGGVARIFVTPRSEEQAIAALALCREYEVKSYIFGNGSNLLVADNGLSGAVIAFGAAMSGIELNGGELTAGAGALLAVVCKCAAEHSLSGLEFAFGIPGSIGGAVYMNAGAYGKEIKDVVTRVRAVGADGVISEISAEQCGFGYRKSSFEQNGMVILKAQLSLKAGRREEIEALMRETLDKRRQKQPVELPSAGSAFKRPENGFAAALIDECGLKGMAVNDAMVSPKHAGFIVNTGAATAGDVQKLLQLVHDEVKRQKGVELLPEIKYWE